MLRCFIENPLLLMAYKTAYNDLIIAQNRVSVLFETYIIINKM